MLKLARIMAVAVVAASCGAEEAPAPPAQAPPRANWEWEAAAGGAALVLRGRDGREIARLTCAQSPAWFRIDVERVAAAATPQPLSLAVDGLSFVFAAHPREGAAGVYAEGPTPGNLFDSLQRADELSLVYGERYLGPFTPPEPQRIAEFTNACLPPQPE